MRWILEVPLNLDLMGCPKSKKQHRQEMPFDKKPTQLTQPQPSSDIGLFNMAMRPRNNGTVYCA